MVLRAQELCESRGGRPGFPVPNKPYGFCGRKATLIIHGALRPQKPYGLLGTGEEWAKE